MVSIIVPVYNCEKFIKANIESIKKQTYSDIEVLLINDGSTDRSEEIMLPLIQNDSRFRYLFQENSGVAIARNNGIRNATGKYLLFIDGDDFIDRDYVGKLVERAELTGADLVICGYTLFYTDGKKNRVISPGHYEKNRTEEWAYRISAVCSRLYLKDFWCRYNIEFIKEKNARAEDVPISIFANVMAKNIQIIQDAGYFYVQHSESAMHKKEKGIPFHFPYETFEIMYNKVNKNLMENSEDFFFFGILKFLAQFEFVIYRNAEVEEKKRFKKWIYDFLSCDFDKMRKSWEIIKKNCKIPFIYKCAIDLFILKYLS